jgi:SHS2 domain-containing protein
MALGAGWGAAHDRDMARAAPLARFHRTLPHTADVGIAARAPTLEALLEEAATAVAEVILGAPLPVGRDGSLPVRVDAPDLPALVFAWLNDVVGIGEARRAVVVSTRIHDVARRPGGDLRLRAEVRMAPLTDGHPVQHHVKSVSFHGLNADQGDDGWTLTAYLDV